MAFWMAFEANLAPFLEIFGSQVGTKLAPNRFKNLSNKSSKQWSHFTSLLDWFLVDFGLQLRRPRGSNEMGFGALGVVLSYLGAKMAPRPLQEGLGTAFGWFVDRFWSIFGPNLVDFWTNFAWLSDQVWLIFVNLFDRCLDKCCLMFQHILVILLSALLDVWAYVGHVAHVPLSSNPQARWRGWPEGQLVV